MLTIKPSLLRSALAALGLALICLAGGSALASPAHASTGQWSIMSDDNQLHNNPVNTLSQMRALGVTMVKVTVRWNSIAPAYTARHAPRGFKASNPGSYPSGNWSYLDTVVRTAAQDGIKVGFMVTGPAPVWAEGPGIPRGHAAKIGNWKPSAPDFGAFVRALGTRYDGHYVPSGASAALPAVSWWSIWNEPNFGPDLAPQAIDGERIDSAAFMYRALLGHAWGALRASGHTTSNNTILIGETAPRGRQGAHFPGNFSGTLPLIFVRALYCASPSDRRLTGAAARANHCPTSASAFRAQNPALFGSSGFADHPYAQGTPPNLPTYACGGAFCVNPRTHRSDPNYADFPEIPRLQSLLQRLGSVYGVHHRVPIWSTEYGFWTRPPDRSSGAISPDLAAYYMNWAEYLSYRNPSILSYAQYLLVDPSTGVFSSGLELANGRELATYAAFRMPLYMPSTSARSATSLTVWGGVRPAAYAVGLPVADIQFKPASGGPWTTVRPVTVNGPRGYFNVKVPFTSSGQVRLAWSPAPGQTDYSRTQAIRIG
ncbi:MAG TPA: hypothetical protein VFP55_06705 [Solirubrobacteraceae bacterium]|nr:hypothetical protein [Solirubrobacteraceae bacterium]